MSSVEERLARVERRLRRQRIIGLVKTLFYVVVFVGVALYLYGLYAASGEWRVEPASAPYVGLRSPRVLEVGGEVNIYNPDGPVMAKLVYYRVYVEDEYVGDGLVPYLDLPSGWSTHRFSVTVDVARLGCGVAEALLSGDNVTVRVEGYAMVDVKTWGGLTWKTLTVPFNVVLGEARVPELDPATRSLLQFIVGLCEYPGNSTILPGFTVPSLPGGPQAGGGGGSVSVVLGYEPAGLGKRRVTVTLVNGLGEDLVVYRVTVNGAPAFEGSLRVPAGDSRTIETDSILPVGSPVRVTVYTSAGSYNATGVVH